MNVVDDNYGTSLSIAVETRNLDLVEFLFAHGADINQEVRCMGNGTVLHMACMVRNANFLLIRFNLIL